MTDPVELPFASELLASRASRVGGLRARAESYVAGPVGNSVALSRPELHQVVGRLDRAAVRRRGRRVSTRPAVRSGRPRGATMLGGDADLHRAPAHHRGETSRPDGREQRAKRNRPVGAESQELVDRDR